MKILEFADLDTSRVKPAYRKVVAAIANGDFRQLAYLSSAKIAVGNRGYHLPVGGLYPRSIQISEFVDLHRTTCFVRYPVDRFAARKGHA